MTDRLEDQIRHYTEKLDEAAPPLEALLPEAMAEEFGIVAPGLRLTASVERTHIPRRGWLVAITAAVAVLVFALPVWLVTLGDDRPVATTSTIAAPTTTTGAPTTTSTPTTTTTTATAADVIQNAANGHFYEAVAVPDGITWEAARLAASGRSHNGIAGHLATFTSEDEYAYVVANLPAAFESSADHNPYWMGGYQVAGSSEPDGGWTWVTGEPFTYAPWAPGEPNDSVAGENCLHPHHDPSDSPLWNDQPCADNTVRGYLVEYDPDR